MIMMLTIEKYGVTYPIYKYIYMISSIMHVKVIGNQGINLL